MDVVVTVRHLASAASTDLRVVAPDSCPSTELLAAIRTSVSGRPTSSVVVETGSPLPENGRALDCDLRDGAILAVTEEVPPREASDSCEVIVHTGPDAGRRWSLAPGDVVIGRGDDADVRLHDPAVSARHARLTIGDGLTCLTDLGSTNGTQVSGATTTGGVVVALGQRFRVGDSELSVSDSVRRPRTPPPPHDAGEVRFPDRPAPPPRARFPVLPAIAPLLAGIALALLVHQWQLLAFTALSPVMVASQTISERRFRRHEQRAAAAAYRLARSAAGRRLAELLRAERRWWHEAVPDVGDCVTLEADRPQDGRSPTRLVLRLGRGHRPSSVRVLGSATPVTARDVPICVPLGELTGLAVSGPRQPVLGLARSLLVQAAARHRCDDLAIVVLAPTLADDWSWVRWLPQSRPRDGEPCRALLALDQRQLQARLRELSAGRPTRDTLVVVDAATAERGLADQLEPIAAQPGRNVVWLTAGTGTPPGWCDEQVQFALPAFSRATYRPRDGRQIDGILTDLVEADVAESAARALAGRPIGTRTRRAASPSWHELAGLDLTDDRAASAWLQRKWGDRACLDVLLGSSDGDPVTINLERDGPHALVAGTTGSGKSELLRTIVTGLAAGNRPDRLTLLLLDYKGGAAFSSCAELPHVAAVVTDLDTATTQRALTSLRAELRRREAAFAAVGAASISEYDAAGPGAPPLPRLVIVVDEFAALAEELPDFVTGLVGVAQRGRSLGVHLILATQRPHGVVSGEIRANTALRLCLAVTRDDESLDVLGTTQAARLPTDRPGVGFLRTGSGQCRPLTVAAVNETSIGPGLTVVASPAATAGDPQPPLPISSSCDALRRLTRAATATARAGGWEATRPPWLPELPTTLSLSELQHRHGPTAWGMVDLPHCQAQPPLTADPAAASSLLVVGAAGSGRTTALQSLLSTLLHQRGPAQLHGYVVADGRTWARVGRLPHIGEVIPVSDIERVAALLDHLATRFVTASHEPVGTATVLVLDSWDSFAEAVSGIDGGRLVDLALRLTAEGAGVGVRVLASSGRTGLAGRLSAAAGEKIVLRLVDPTDYCLLGLGVQEVSGPRPPGRGIRAHDHAQVQIAIADALTTTPACAQPPAGHRPRRFAPLPRHVELPPRHNADNADELVLGVGAGDLEAVGLRRDECAGGLLVAGPPRSGRSTVLSVLACQLDDRPIAAVCSRRSPLASHPGIVALPGSEAGAAMLDQLRRDAGQAPHLLVDDVDLLEDGPLAECVEAAVREARATESVVALAGTVESLGAALRGPVAVARRARVGVLLRPQRPHDGDVLGLRLRHCWADDPPGRGMLAVHGRAVRLHCAVPPRRVSPQPSPVAPRREPVPQR